MRRMSRVTVSLPSPHKLPSRQEQQWNRLLGVISLKDLLGFLSTKMEIEGYGNLNL